MLDSKEAQNVEPIGAKLEINHFASSLNPKTRIYIQIYALDLILILVLQPQIRRQPETCGSVPPFHTTLEFQNDKEVVLPIEDLA